MAKAKDIPLDVDEENEIRGKCAGMLPEEIKSAASAIRTQQQKSSEIAGDLSGKLEIFQKKGGHKSALKMAAKIAAMEPSECADFMRAFDAYFDVLGGNSQLDMFDQEQEKSKNEASVDVATKQATAQASKLASVPKKIEEPALH